MKRRALSVALLFSFLTLTVAAQTVMDHAGPALTTEKRSYAPGETIGFVGTNWAPGEEVRILVSGEGGANFETLLAKADDNGRFRVTTEMPNAPELGEHRRLAATGVNDGGNNSLNNGEHDGDEGVTFHATATGALPSRTADADFDQGPQETDGERLLEQEIHWAVRQSYPLFKFDPQWVRKAAEEDKHVQRRTPAGRYRNGGIGMTLSTTGFTALGPQPEHMTGCSGCFDYGTTAGRINDIRIDPTTTTQGSIVAYAASVGGGVWKTTNCCTSSTTWSVTTDDPVIATTSIDSIAMDPNNHNVVYAGTGDLNYGSFSMGSQGILKTTDAGAHWTVLGANIFGAMLPAPVGTYPQYQAVGKVRVDPNNSNNVVAGAKTGLYFSYDGGANWTGPCFTNSFTSLRQDITGLELSNMGGGVTRILAAVGVRGFASPVQFNLDQNGANGIYKATMGASGCPSFTSITSNANGFVYDSITVTGTPYTASANMNATSGTNYTSATAGNQLGRIEIAVAPSNPNVLYAQVQSIAINTDSGCGSANGCQLGIWASTDGGTTWSFMRGSAGGALTPCTGAAGSGDYPQNWYDQGIAVDPNNPDRIFVDTFDVWLGSRTGTSFYDVGCAYTPAIVVHADQHALAFVPGSSSILLAGNDGGVDVSTNADTAVIGTTRNTFTNMDGGLNTIEFYSGDISGNFATSARPQVSGGAQDNGPSSATFTGSPTGPVQWQMGLGGDGFFSRIDPVGTGLSAAQGTITLTTGGALAGETFTIGSQTFTWQVAARTGAGQVQIASSTTTAGNNIVTAVNADLAGVVTAARSGATVVVTAVTTGTAGNSIVFTEASTNMTMDGSGTLGGTYQGGFDALRFWQGNNSGGLSRCINNCTAPGAAWSSKRGAWTGDTQAFQLPIDIFHGGIPGGDDCPPAAPGGGCGHLLAGTTRVWETITGNASGSGGTVTWYVNSPPNVTKQTLGGRSYINQIKFSPKYESVAMLGTNDGNVLIGFGLGSGSGPTPASGTITVGGTPVANQTFTVATQTFTWRAASTNTGGDVTIGGTTATSATNIVSAITNTLAGVVTAARSGSTVTVASTSTGPAGNSIVFANGNSTGLTFNPNTGTLAGGSAGVANWVDVTNGNAVLPNRPVFGIALDPSATAANLPAGYVSVGGFDDLTPTTPGHVFRIDCTAANCASFTWTDKSGNLPNIPVDSVAVNPNFVRQVFAGTDFGLYYTDDITANPPVWYRFTNGLPNVMIWDMQIDRGSTTLSLWTRSRGAYVWPLPSTPLAPLATVLTVTSASGTYGGSPVSLSATLTSGGNPVSGESVSFTLNGTGVGTAVTNASGVASLASASLASVNAGSFPTGVGASFAGDSTYAAATATNALTIAMANPTVTATGGSFTYTAAPHAGSGSATGGKGESLTTTLSYSGTGTTTYGPSATAPTNAGTYQVVAHTAGDANNNAGDSSPAAISIAKATATINVTGYCALFDSSPHTAAGTATGVVAESLTGLVLTATTHTTAGTYLSDGWTFSNANYADASGSVNDAIVNAAITAPSSLLIGAGGSASVVDAGTGATYAWSVTNGTLNSGSGTRTINFTAAGAAGTTTLHVTVTTTTACSDTKSANVSIVPPGVSVTNVAPAAGRIGGGTPVTITGSGFQNGATVTIGGTAATSVVVVNATSITAVTAAHAVGAVAVTVTNTDTGTGTLPSGYTYLAHQFDANGDTAIDPSDIFYLVNYLYLSGQGPRGAAGWYSGDANGDMTVDPSDIFYLVNYLFSGGPAPMSEAPKVSTVRISGKLTLGQPVTRGDRRVVPVTLTLDDGSAVPQALALRVRVTGNVRDAAIHRAGATSGLAVSFENTPRTDGALSYLVSFDPRRGGLSMNDSGTGRTALVAEIELAPVGREGFALELDPALTMLSNAAGSVSATVGAGTLQVNGIEAGAPLQVQPARPRNNE
jgi:hypothetical protein